MEYKVKHTGICGCIGFVGVAVLFLLFFLDLTLFPLPSILPGESMLIGVSALPDSCSFLSGSRSSGGKGGGSK